MRRTYLLALIVPFLLGATLLCAADQATAADVKPIVTLSFSGYDALVADIDYLGKLGGNPNMSQGIEAMLKMMTQGKGLEGLDTKQPWGLVIVPNENMMLEGPTMLAFLPVTDMDKLLAVLAPFGVETEDADNGAKQLIIPDGPPELYAKQVGNWAYISNKTANFDNAPADPVSLLGGADKKYDVALNILVKNLPDDLRQMFLGQIDMIVGMTAMQQPEENDEDHAARVKMTQQMVEQIKTLINELDTLTVGLVTNDADGQKTYLDIEITAKPDTKTAKEMATVQRGSSQFAGFYVPDATLTANWISQLTEQNIAQTTAQIEAAYKQFLVSLEDQNLDEDKYEKAKKLTGELVDVLIQTIKNGKSDGGVAVWLDANTAAVAGGGLVVDGEKIESVLKEIVALAIEDNSNVKSLVQLDAETYQGVNLHKLSMPIPPGENSDKAVELMGENLEMVVGTCSDAVYVAMGRDAMSKLKAALDASKSAAGEEVLPVRASLALTPLFEFLAKVVPDEDSQQQMQMAATVLEQAGSENHVLLTAEPIPNGIRERIEVEPGLLKVLGGMSQGMGGGSMPMPGAMPMP